MRRIDMTSFFSPWILAGVVAFCISGDLGLVAGIVQTPAVTAMVPDGWEQVGPGMAFRAPGSGGNRPVLSFEIPQETDDSFDVWFSAAWQKLTQGHGGLEATPVQRKQLRKGGYSTALVAGSMESGPGYIWVMFFAARNGRLIQPIVFIARDAAGYNDLTGTVAGIVNSIEFVPGGRGEHGAGRNADEILASLSGTNSPRLSVSRVPPGADSGTYSVRPGTLDGIYAGITTSSNLSVHGGYITEVVREHIVFTMGGHACWCLPEEGLEGASEDSLMRSPIAGTYRISGDQVAVHWKSGNDALYILSPDGRIGIKGSKYERLVSGDGLVLNGTYTRFSGSNGSTITFRPDGTFSDSGILAQTGIRFRGGTYISLNPAPTGPGRYRISRYTLTLAYQSGIIERVGFYVLPAEMKNPVDIIRLNSFAFQRVAR